MAFEGDLQNTWTWEAGADLSAAQYHVVSVATTGAVSLATATAANQANASNFVGVLQNNPTSGKDATVALAGSITKAVKGAAAVAIGDTLTVTTAGKVSTATATTQVVVGQALSASTATAAGEVITVLLSPGTRP